LWWLGAAFLVAGSVIIGRREEGKEVGAASTAGAEPTVVAQDAFFQDDPDAPHALAEGVAINEAEAYKDSIELERKPKTLTRKDRQNHDE